MRNVAVVTSERDIAFTSDGVRLAGLLALPDDTAHLGVVMVGGSGAADRNNDVYFPLIRPYLVDAGIAVLSYDKRGVGGSAGDWRACTLDDLATDVIAAVARLREEGIERVGLFGHSEGGWVVLRAGARSDAPWVVANSCPGMTPAEQDRFGTTNWLREQGATDEEIALAAAHYDVLLEAGRRGAAFAEIRSLLADVDDRYELWSDLDAPTWEFLKRKQDHDPLPDMRALHCPVLATYGGADRLVPVHESIRLFSAIACEPGRDPRATFDVAVFPAANHRVQSETGDLAVGYLERLISWISACPAPDS